VDTDSINNKNRTVHHLVDELKDENDITNQDVIVVDGRGYEDDSPINEEVYNLVDVIDEHQLNNKQYEDIMQRVEKIVENITRKMVPEIAERVIKEEIEKSKRADKWLNLVAFLGIIGYLYATFHFWNIGVTSIALILMFVRLPDLLWEIKTGKKVTRSVAQEMPKNVLYFITTFLTFAALPALYYFLYHF